MSNTLPSGMFNLNEFHDSKRVLKLAPDAFAIIGDNFISAAEATDMSPGSVSQSDGRDTKTGITSINVSSTVTSPGAGTCQITISVPTYEDWHSDYFTRYKNGSIDVIFKAMMPVQIFFKSRRQVTAKNEQTSITDTTPVYYRCFMGYLSHVSVSQSGNKSEISLTGRDFLYTWKYQKQMITAGVAASALGAGASAKQFAKGNWPTYFFQMSAWQIVTDLFSHSYSQLSDMLSFPFARDNGAIFSQDYAIWQKTAEENMGKAMMAMSAKSAMVSFNGTKVKDQGSGSTGTAGDGLEIYGLLSKLKVSIGNRVANVVPEFKFSAISLNSEKVDASTDQTYLSVVKEPGDTNYDLEFGVLGYVQPYGNYNNTVPGLEPVYATKLEILANVASQVNYEVFQDMNGKFVFKPPFYNAQTQFSSVYRLEAPDIISFHEESDSDRIVNYVELTSPLMAQLNSDGVNPYGFAMDMVSIQKYGIRQTSQHISYGGGVGVLMLLAAAEVFSSEPKSYSASASIPLRPEMRLGYPMYIPHMDAYYYVTGISHSFTFGSSAVTSLTMETKRTKDKNSGYNYGYTGRQQGSVMVWSDFGSNDEKDSEYWKNFGTNSVDASKQTSLSDARKRGMYTLNQTLISKALWGAKTAAGDNDDTHLFTYRADHGAALSKSSSGDNNAGDFYLNWGESNSIDANILHGRMSEYLEKYSKIKYTNYDSHYWDAFRNKSQGNDKEAAVRQSLLQLMYMNGKRSRSKAHEALVAANTAEVKAKVAEFDKQIEGKINEIAPLQAVANDPFNKVVVPVNLSTPGLLTYLDKYMDVWQESGLRNGGYFFVKGTVNAGSPNAIVNNGSLAADLAFLYSEKVTDPNKLPGISIQSFNAGLNAFKGPNQRAKDALNKIDVINKDIEAIQKQKNDVLFPPKPPADETNADQQAAFDVTNQASETVANASDKDNRTWDIFTDGTVPYTDINGYRHIGAFPYGANIVIRDHGDVGTGLGVDSTALSDKIASLSPQSTTSGNRGSARETANN